jgi:UDP-2-acetamido-2,6-beta-L-arabino-hexul-4-ose reductase
MKNVLVTGAAGFIGKNLITALQRLENISLTTITSKDEWLVLESALEQVDIIYHLAGINRPQNEEEFALGNTEFTRKIVQYLEVVGRKAKIIIPSSIQAELENPYGRSKKAAEDVLLDYNRKTGASVAIYRLPNVFGKWSRPNYNTVVATFCHNIACGLDIVISDPNRELELVYIDDVVAEFLRHLDENGTHDQQRYTVSRTFRVTLGGLAGRIRQLHEIRTSLIVPDLADDLMKCLHATYLSFLPEKEFAYPVKLNTDNRGWLFELLKSEHFGQIFVSKTLPGITRGDHYHDSKLEKFCVIQGEAVIRFRHIHSQEVLAFPVSGNDIKVVDIPPGYTHSIENIGQDEMVCLFWANQIFSPEQPDTYWEKVII